MDEDSIIRIMGRNLGGLLTFFFAQMNEAAMAALEEKLTSTETTLDALTIKTSHFKAALSKVSPSVSDMV